MDKPIRSELLVRQDKHLATYVQSDILRGRKVDIASPTRTSLTL